MNYNDEDEEDENGQVQEDAQNEEVANQSNSSKFSNFLKNPIRSFGSRATNAVGNLIREVWNKVPLKIKLLIVAGIVFLIIIIVIIQGVIKEASKSVIDSIDTSIADSIIKDLDPDTQKLYENKGSLIRFKIKDIDTMYQTFLKQEIKTAETKEALEKVYGINNVNSDKRIVNVNDRIELYKHILFTEKYNFNNIKWKQYSHIENGTDSQLTEDTELGLKYPKDQNNTELDTFINFTLPYIQTWFIPLSMNSGNLNKGLDNDTQKGKNFTYSIIKEAFSDILVNRYDVQKYTLNTKYNEYDEISKHIEYTIGKNTSTVYVFNPVTGKEEAVTKDTYYIVSSKEVEEPGNKRHVNERLNTDGRVDPLKEDFVSDSTTIKNKYFIKEAKTFDVMQVNSFEYKKYSEKDTKSRINAKSEVETKKDKYYVEGKIPSFSIPQSTGTFSGDSFIVKDGNTHYISRIWEDDLTQNSNETKLYTYDDVVEYNENKDSNPSKTTIAKELFNASISDVDYYQLYESDKTLNRIDLINSNPGIYANYLNEGSEYSNYVGYSRPYLKYSYIELKDLLENMKQKYGKIPFIYGRTLGIDETYFSSGTNGVGTTAGAGLGAMVNRAIELGESGGVWHYCQGGSNITVSGDLGRGFFNTIEEMNGLISNGIMQGMDCSAFVWSMYKTYTGIDISNSGGANSGMIAAVAKSNSGKSLPGAENITVDFNSITNLDDLQPGDVLYREGHIGLYVGKINGKYMQVDLGGPGGLADGRLCSFSSGTNHDWVGPKYHEITTTTYTNYIHYSGFATGSVVEEDIFNSGTVSLEDQKELLASIDNYNSGKSSSQWGTVNNAWTLQYYRDNDVELIARIICHENGLYNTSETNEGAVEMVKYMTLIMMNRIYGISGNGGAGTAYDAILAKNQFYSGSGRYDAFNQAPPQWVRQLVYDIYNGIQAPPEYWDKDLYYWAGPSDGSSVWSTGAWTGNSTQDYSQVVAIKIDNSWVWHCFMKLVPKGTGNRSIISPSNGYYNNQWHISSSATLAPGKTSVYIP